VRPASSPILPVPFVDLRLQYRSIEPDIDAAVREVLDAAAFIKGRFVAAFEKSFAEFCGVDHCIGVANGTDAIRVVLAALGIGPGDEVVTVAHTFTATAEPIVRAGARPVFVDVDPATNNMDPDLVERAVGPRTRAILPVHLYGLPADMDRINAVAARHGIVVIEDAAQAAGARYKGRRCGSLGNVACFSFFPGKNLGAYGDGGAVCTSDRTLAEKVRMLADHGRTTKYEHQLVGYNSRLDGLQAAVLSVKLRHLDGWNAARRDHALAYARLLGHVVGLTLPAAPDWAEPIWHLYVVESENRKALQEALRSAAIETGIHYPVPLHRQPCYSALASSPLPVTEHKAGRILSLPMFAELTTPQMERVAAAVAAFC
jgi:dTDP-4-amino-4,6-dideoxygalactose transaminase